MCSPQEDRRRGPEKDKTSPNPTDYAGSHYSATLWFGKEHLQIAFCNGVLIGNNQLHAVHLASVQQSHDWHQVRQQSTACRAPGIRAAIA